MKKTTWIILGIIVLVVIYVLVSYNSFVSLSESVDNQWAQVETQYQRRFDLIPNLVNSVKGILTQEQEIFGAIAEARTRYAGANTVADKVASANEVETSFGRLLAIMENYPQLQSSENIQTLMAQLEGAENRVSVERQRFNDNTRVYNVTIKRFPANILASLFGFAEKAYFESIEGSEEAPVVEL
ncbi:MAG: LemA family protein [bacterium]|nr:LemA family protein [bacterium]